MGPSWSATVATARRTALAAWLLTALLAAHTPAALAGVGALWEGGDDRLGKTFWQSVDAGVFSGVAETALKYVFSRERPSQTSDPNRWFTGHGQSFPSGEVTTTSSLVTPFVLEYGR